MSQEAKQQIIAHQSGGDLSSSKDYVLRTGTYDQFVRLQFRKVTDGWTSLRNMHNNNNIGIDKHNTKKLNTNKTDNSGSMVEWQILAVLNNPGDEVHAIDADSPPRDAWKPVGEYIMLNVDNNYGLSLENKGAVKGQHFTKFLSSGKSLSQLDNHKIRFYKSDEYPESFKMMVWHREEGQFYNVKLSDEPYYSKPPHWAILPTSDDEEAMVLNIRRPSNEDTQLENFEDDFGAQPFSITTINREGEELLMWLGQPHSKHNMVLTDKRRNFCNLTFQKFH
eukprot:Selendium_serpulae@DN6252_c0_g2_i4.p1